MCYKYDIMSWDVLTPNERNYKLNLSTKADIGIDAVHFNDDIVDDTYQFKYCTRSKIHYTKICTYHTSSSVLFPNSRMNWITNTNPRYSHKEVSNRILEKFRKVEVNVSDVDEIFNLFINYTPMVVNLANNYDIDITNDLVFLKYNEDEVDKLLNLDYTDETNSIDVDSIDDDSADCDSAYDDSEDCDSGDGDSADDDSADDDSADGDSHDDSADDDSADGDSADGDSADVDSTDGTNPTDTSSNMNGNNVVLLDYQIEAVELIEKYHSEGKDCVIKIFCGLGKSYIINESINRIVGNNICIVLCNSLLLQSQIGSTLNRDKSVCIVNGKSRLCQAQVYIATFSPQTINKLLLYVNTNELVINNVYVDEGHHLLDMKSHKLKKILSSIHAPKVYLTGTTNVSQTLILIWNMELPMVIYLIIILLFHILKEMCQRVWHN